MCLYVCMPHVWVSCRGHKRVNHVTWGLTSRPTQEPCTVFSTEPFLQPLIGTFTNISVTSGFISAVAGTLLWCPWDAPEWSEMRQLSLGGGMHPQWEPIGLCWVFWTALKKAWDSGLRLTSHLLWFTSFRRRVSLSFVSAERRVDFAHCTVENICAKCFVLYIAPHPICFVILIKKRTRFKHPLVRHCFLSLRCLFSAGSEFCNFSRSQLPLRSLGQLNWEWDGFTAGQRIDIVDNSDLHNNSI